MHVLRATTKESESKRESDTVSERVRESKRESDRVKVPTVRKIPDLSSSQFRDDCRFARIVS